jgi:hypothetical protein
MTGTEDEMTLAQILGEARERLGDTRPKFLWSDSELVGYLNESINEVAEQKRLFRDSVTAAICQISVLGADANPDYLMDTRICEIISAKMRCQKLFLTRKTNADLEAWNPDWRSATASTPLYFLTDYTEGYLTINPKSDQNDTIDLTVYRLPINQMTLDTSTASPEIHFKHHLRLLNGMLARAYLKEDSETLDPQKAERHGQLWRLDMNEIGKSRIRLHDAGEFVGPHYGAI